MKLTTTSLALIAAAGLLSFDLAGRAQTNTPPGGAGAPGARPGGGQRGSVDAQLARLSEQLKLTDEQKPKVKAILEEQNKKLLELRNDTATPQEERRAKALAVREEVNKKMKEVLTAEQFKQYEELSQRGRRGGPGGGPGAGGPGPNHPPNAGNPPGGAGQ